MKIQLKVKGIVIEFQCLCDFEHVTVIILSINKQEKNHISQNKSCKLSQRIKVNLVIQKYVIGGGKEGDEKNVQDDKYDDDNDWDERASCYRPLNFIITGHGLYQLYIVDFHNYTIYIGHIGKMQSWNLNK